ncbi:MAG: hypothetical protein FJ303_22775 [Planctomycetes bacterium]|nr:hypothetical protein [Planctomycetota bacterium]
MDPSLLLTFLCFYGPTVLAAILAGWQGQQCSSPWQAFAVALIGTVALAVVFGVAFDYLPLWGVGMAYDNKMWRLHLTISPLAGLLVATFCGVVVHRRTQFDEP